MRVFVSGGAGFIGSHLCKRLLLDKTAEAVVIFDNFSSGKKEFLDELVSDPRLQTVESDLQDLPKVTAAMEGCDVVFHLASNPDIAKAVDFPPIDFWNGTYLTQNIVEAARINRVKRLIYTSGSGVYGDRGLEKCSEDQGPLLPISTYAASKIAGETIICAYCHMFEMEGVAFRFANVVGPHQTHGVAYDFVRRMYENPRSLRILGDGTQSKSYIYVDDVIEAMFLVINRVNQPFDCFNVASEDYITVRDIANLVTQQMGLESVEYQFTEGDRGWKGDVPIVRFDCSKIQSLGWRAKCSSSEAIRKSIDAMIKETEKSIDRKAQK
jgi:UDP-glucose 4-epimerase